MPLIHEPSPCVHGHERRRTNSGRIYCPTCNKKYVDDNKQLVADYKKQWANENPDKTRETWYRNKHKYIDRRKSWEERNKESQSEKKKEYKKQLHPLFSIWVGMNYRCHVSNSFDYKSYGQIGVLVYEPWRMLRGKRNKLVIEENARRFRDFVDYVEANLGERPDGYTLDRHPDYKGNYEPNNLRWASARQQANNRKDNLNYRQNISDYVLVGIGMSTVTLKQLSENTGIHLDVIKDRYALFGDLDLIINKKKLVNRKYEYNGNSYSLYELVIVSRLSRTVLKARINQYGWSVRRAVETPILTSIDEHR